MDVLNRAALLHDLGRYVIPEEVLSRSGPLSRSDWALVRQHPAVAERIVGQLRFLQREASVIRHHHERVDGSGYPDGLVGDAIPVGARIVAVADVYDALTSDRPYRPAMSAEEASAHLRAQAGQGLDEDIVSTFLVVARHGAA
jgi:HD-GYP domain-containing protein (c-di-GMP phosphodiesterase class II)